MKQLNLVIETCGGTIDAVQCPYCLHEGFGHYVCTKSSRWLDDIMTIPSWCKLEDKEEA